ncbi:glycosyltransferase family 39 protein [Candidatus Methanoplasma termitum]|nr:glycosyltransferase family 39 protein [Candidatus Methanoplasma termitum]
MDYWAVIIRNIESGQGLYGLEGYYYTPVWGYFLSFQSVIQELFMNINVMGLRVPETFSIETLPWGFTSNVTSVAFNTAIKIPFLISDLIVGYLVYWLIKDRTQDMRKATVGFALWFLCPIVIMVTSAAGMFDTFAVLFTLLCIVMVRKDKLFLAGVLLTFAILTKFFPIYLLFILLAYVYVKHRGEGSLSRSLFKAVAGALAAFFILMLPQIWNGEVSDSLLFLSSRISEEGGSILIKGAMLLNIICLAAAILFGILLSRKSKEKVDDYFFIYALPLVLMPFISPGLPQYLVLAIPFLAFFIVWRNKHYFWPWLLISIGGSMFIIARYCGLLVSAGAFTDLISLNDIVSAMITFNTPLSHWSRLIDLSYQIAHAVELGVVLGLLFFVLEWYKKGCRGEDVFGSVGLAFVLRLRHKLLRTIGGK